jgi:hypothetical protein
MRVAAVPVQCSDDMGNDSERQLADYKRAVAVLQL